MTEREIFLTAIDLPDPTARSVYLDEVCGADAGLRGRVEELLRSHESAGSFLSTPAVVLPGPNHGEKRAFTPDAGAGADRPGEDHEEDTLPLLAPPRRADSLGRIGHYEVLQVLGRGAFGVVFRAFDDVLQRVVAVKVLAPRMAATSPARKRFLREARASAQIRHENVVQVYEVGEDPLPHLVMEFIPGESLQARLDRTGPVEPAEVVRVGRQIAKGLAAAHAVNLVHRDIKPGNILLEDGTLNVKLTDFGLAKAADDACISQSGVIAGTPMYMSPEQAKGDSIDPRADLFSLGSVLYQMTTGRPPFRANSTMAVLKRVAEDTPRPVREIIPETPQWLIEIVAKLHAKNPDERFQSARELADLLAECEVQGSRPLPRKRPEATRRWVWPAGFAVVVLPLLAMAVTESAGVSHLLPVRRMTNEPVPLGIVPERVSRVPSEVPAPETKAPAVAPLTDADVKRIAALPAVEQIEEVRKELKRRNPNFDGTLTPTTENDTLTRVEFSTLEVTDISPVRALKGLKELACCGTERMGKLTDLSPLAGLQLTFLDCNNNGRLADLSPLQGMPLKELRVQHTQVRELAPVVGSKLEHLNCSHTAVRDLAPLKGMPLITLYLDGTKVADLTPLREMPLKLLNVRNLDLRPDRDGDVLRSLAQLEEINSDSVAEFLRRLDGK